MGEGIWVRLVYEGHQVTGAKNVETPYSRGVKSQSAITVFL